MYFQTAYLTRRPAQLAAVIPLIILGYINSVAAQSNPSADEIINSLRPSGAASGMTTRGIHPINPSAVAPASPMEAPAPINHAAESLPRRPSSTHDNAPVVAANGGEHSVNLTVNFASGSARLTDTATQTLDELGRALSSNTLAGYKFRIEGHTDTKGSADANKTLSQARARAVVDYLATRFNIDRSRLVPVGMGQEGLLIPTPPETPEPRNRRVQVVNIGT